MRERQLAAGRGGGPRAGTPRATSTSCSRGRADVERDGVKLAELGPGDFFGELAALDWGAGYGYARLATVTATSALRLAAFAPAHLDALIRTAPSAAECIEDALRVRRPTV